MKGKRLLVVSVCLGLLMAVALMTACRREGFSLTAQGITNLDSLTLSQNLVVSGSSNLKGNIADSANSLRLNDNVLVIGAEVYSRILNWKDRTTCVFFGDGAGAALVQKVEEGRGILGSWLRADGRGSHVIEIPAGGVRSPISASLMEQGDQYFHMDGRAVWDFAIVAFPQAVRGVLERYGYGLEDVDMVIPHQANINIITTGMERLGLPMEKAFTNLHRYANMAGASIPVALHDAVKEGKIRKGDLVVTAGFGGGLAWGANLIRW